MNDIPTPRTDAATEEFEFATVMYGGEIGGGVKELVAPDFARTLERELATAIAKLSNVEKERDAAQLAAKDATNKAYELDHQIEGFRTKLAETERLNRHYATATASLEAQLESTRASLAGIEKERDHLEDRCRDIAAVSRSLRAEIERKDAALRQIAEDVTVSSLQSNPSMNPRAIARAALSTNAPEGVTAQPDPTQPWREVVEEIKNKANAVMTHFCTINGDTAWAQSSPVEGLEIEELEQAICRAEALLRKGEVRG